ncbi:MAG TPA: N-acetylmuramoyl-L-alanine amidase [Opitutaceae bacterium]|nr:N-acetylmuramoyl-L-alanine amidase [Opitutaceae bacterium]
MKPAARGLLALGFATLLSAASLPAANESAARNPPTRPVALAATRINGLDYVSVDDAARWLNLAGAWAEPRHKFVLTGRSDRLELNADSRETLLNGLRVILGDPTMLRSDKLYLSRIDLERCLGPRLRPSLAGSPPPAVKVIALDPGHGGTDPGKENIPLGLKEKELTLDVVFRLKKQLEAGGYRVVLTRTSDATFSPDKKKDLLLRAKAANDAGADLFVSVHFNSLSPDTRTTGTELYTFAPANQHAADWWGGTRKDDPYFETADEPVNRYDGWSAVLSQALHRDLIGSLKTVDRGAKVMHLEVLRTLDCPAVLVEAVFLSNNAEARRAAMPEYRERIAGAIFSGIRDYAALVQASRPPEVTLPAGPTSTGGSAPSNSK